MTLLRAILVWVGITAGSAVAPPAAMAAPPAGLTDTGGHRPPSLMLPRAGGSYVDPVFGTRILRVTDAQDGRRCVHAYSYWPALNVDATRLLLSCDGEALLYRFDPDTFTVKLDGKLRGTDGPDVDFEGASWSASAPDVLFGLEGTRLWRIDVARRGMSGFTMVRDFAADVGAQVVLAQLHVSRDDRTFTFHSRDLAAGVKLDAFAYDLDQDRLWTFARGDYQIDETKLDKLGRWVMVDGSTSNPGFLLWSFRTGEVVEFRGGDPAAKPGGHVDMGADLIVNSDGWNTGLLVRGYDRPLGEPNLRNIVRYLKPSGAPNWSLADHVSLRADDETYAVASTYRGDGTYAAFEDEIFLVRTDGAGVVRLAHTRAARSDYWAQPRAVVDRSGRFVVYTSDLGDLSRLDVLLLEVPDAYVPGRTASPGAGGTKPGPAEDEPVTEPGPGAPGCTVSDVAPGAAGRRAWAVVVALGAAVVTLVRRRRYRSLPRRDRTAA